MKKTSLLALLILSVIFSGFPAGLAGAGTIPQVPADGMVTLVDLGAHKCIPCKMMAPILKKLKAKYQDQAAIVFIDVWENRDQAKKYGIRSIPTQIFYNENGKEVFRHVGFMSEKDIVKQLEKMGVSARPAG